MEQWTLTIEQPLYERLCGHLFPGDNDEHGAVIAAGIITTKRGTRLLARNLFLAQDSDGFVPAVRGYRRLPPQFVLRPNLFARDPTLPPHTLHNPRPRPPALLHASHSP